MGYIVDRKREGTTIYPATDRIFYALQKTSFEKTRVVWLGLDPYADGCANGLCFETANWMIKPPSLVHIIKSIVGYDYTLEKNSYVSLETWPEQGILLLNRTLTVEEKASGSHTGLGWEDFTTSIIKHLAKRKTKCVFVLIGSANHQLKGLIEGENRGHFTICLEHPAYAQRQNRRWEYNDCYNKINTFLEQNNQKPIEWDTILLPF
jgi:uracil-DNA glycosylase